MESYQIDVKIVHSQKDLNQVYRLTHDTFVDRGIITPQPDGRLMNHVDWDMMDRTIILGAFAGKKLVGTISISLSSKNTDVFCYEIFKESIDKTFVAGEQSSSGWRMAVELEDRIMQTLVVLKLIEAVHEYLLKKRVDSTYFSFIKDHHVFYKKMFIGGEIIDEKNLKTEIANTDLYFMRYKPNFAVLMYLRNRIEKVEAMVERRVAASAAVA